MGLRPLRPSATDEHRLRSRAEAKTAGGAAVSVPPGERPGRSMTRTSTHQLTRLEKLEAVVQPDRRCACGLLPQPVRALVVSLAGGAEDERPLAAPVHAALRHV